MLARCTRILGCCCLAIALSGLNVRAADRSPKGTRETEGPPKPAESEIENDQDPAPAIAPARPQSSEPHGQLQLQNPKSDAVRPKTADTDPSRPQPGQEPEGEQAPLPPAWRDILESRRAQGSVFDGTWWNDLASPATEDEFLDALRHVAADQGDTPHTYLPTSVCAATSARHVQGEHVEPATTADDLELAKTLRVAARQLGNKAADLEDQRRYTEADRLRGLARRLRTEARGWAPPASTSLPQQDVYAVEPRRSAPSRKGDDVEAFYQADGAFPGTGRGLAESQQDQTGQR